MNNHAEDLAKLGWQYFECSACGSEGAKAFPKPKQEPVAWMCSDESLTNKGYSRFSRTCEGAWNIPVYTTPPQRTWVELTDEEIKALASWWPSYDQMPALMVLAKDIQNSLKEKNT